MEETPSRRYVVAIHRTPAGYFARVVDLPGCISRGASEVEALENARAMLRVHLALGRLCAVEEPRVRLEISA